MRKYGFYLLLLSLSLLSCNKEEAGGSAITTSGLLQRQGATTYQYGTHTLSTATTFYVIQSSRVSLDPYIGQTVTVTGSRSAGVSGGPDLIEVETIQ